ncbi:MAG: N-formylglutamate amidohydrolase [Bacteroidota bacterium]|nr:N-formylglutamate amidohydrolase [Bacteroidota bacterium]
MSSFKIHEEKGPFIATAIHDGHLLRKNLLEVVNLNDQERLREEDPFTGSWVDIADTWIKVQDSRFEVDLNRPREKAVYVKPEDAWGLKVWKNDLPVQKLTESLQKYDNFYIAVKELLDKKVAEFGGFLVYDLHTYNHKRDGGNIAPADPAKNPEVNIGTGNMDRKKWASVVDSFITSLSSFDYHGRNLDVRENIKFQGGHFLRWIHDNYPGKSCVLAIEFKKFFMDEWTGTPDPQQVSLIKKALKSTVPDVLKNFEAVNTVKT